MGFNKPNNYFKFDPNFELRMSNYQNYDLPFIIKRGDEIRVSYEGDGEKYTQFKDLKTVIFQVHGVTGGSSGDYSSGDVTAKFQSLGTPITLSLSSSLSDKILVTPDPSTLADPIPSGSIHSFTIIRKQEDETKVTIRVPNTAYSSPSISNYITDYTGTSYTWIFNPK
jgi:hypothetical protein